MNANDTPGYAELLAALQARGFVASLEQQGEVWVCRAFDFFTSMTIADYRAKSPRMAVAGVMLKLEETYGYEF